MLDIFGGAGRKLPVLLRVDQEAVKRPKVSDQTPRKLRRGQRLRLTQESRADRRAREQKLKPASYPGRQPEEGFSGRPFHQRLGLDSLLQCRGLGLGGWARYFVPLCLEPC